MKKLRKITRMRDEAWGWLSKWIRLKNADPDGFVNCYTCDKKIFWKEANAGHWKHGHNKPTFLLEDNVKPQCISCNLHKSGALDVYTLNLLKVVNTENLDEDTINSIKEMKIKDLEEINRLSHEVVKLNRDYYQLKIDTYKEFYESRVRTRLEKGYTV